MVAVAPYFDASVTARKVPYEILNQSLVMGVVSPNDSLIRCNSS